MVRESRIMASAPNPNHSNPDVWQAVLWVLQQGWVIILGLVIWLINKLYTLLFDKRNAEVDERLKAQDEKLDELLDAVHQLQLELAEMRGAQGPPPRKR